MSLLHILTVGDDLVGRTSKGFMEDELLLTTSEGPSGNEEINRRHQRFSQQVAEGKRSALSLIAIPAALAKSSRVTYPVEPFGEPQEW